MAFTDQTMIDKTDQWAVSFNEAYMNASKGVDPERILEMREKLERRTKRGDEVFVTLEEFDDLYIK